jgi:hypothetical protein
VNLYRLDASPSPSRSPSWLISYLSYRIMLLAIIAGVGACAAFVLVRPAPEPLADAAPEEEAERDPISAGSAGRRRGG